MALRTAMVHRSPLPWLPKPSVTQSPIAKPAAEVGWQYALPERMIHV